MKKYLWKLAILLFISTNFSCNDSEKIEVSDVSQYTEYITAFSSGTISAHDNIEVVLNFEKQEWKPGTELSEKLFTLEPNVKGKVIVSASNKLVFKPNEKLKSNQTYGVTLHLDKIVKVEESLKNFVFKVKTIKQDVWFEFVSLESHSREKQYIKGIIETSDLIDAKTLKECFSVSSDADGATFELLTNNEKGTSYEFKIDNIIRQTDDSKVKLKFNGDEIDCDDEEISMDIPGKNKLTIVRIFQQHKISNTLVINFSDPLKKSQYLNGMVVIGNYKGLITKIEGNLLYVFLTDEINGSHLVEIFLGIEDIYGNKLKQTYSEKFNFELQKPEIKFIKTGVILPDNNKTEIYFKAINLKKVDIKIHRVYQSNVLQFLQVNNLSGTYEMRRVAKPIAKKTIDLAPENSTQVSQWSTYSIHLDEIIKAEPGAIYKVEISFKPSYSTYKCNGKKPAFEEESIDDNDIEDEESSYNSYDDYEGDYEYYEDDYEWRERENPCSRSYYYGRSISCNILASNIGLIAKKGKNNSLLVAAANILTTEPIANAEIEIYTFQQQQIGKAKTDNNGFAEFSNIKGAYFVIAKHSNQFSYLKTESGNSLSVSNFEVDGQTIERGLKGYIYGERGVWRPGDSLYLSFILNDLANPLPDNHPIKLKITNPQGVLKYQTVVQKNANNHYRFKVGTSTEDITGNWEALISVGGANFYKGLKIETIKPNRLKINNNKSDKIIEAKTDSKIKIQATWLHGSIGKNLKIDVKAKFYKDNKPFKNYESYGFQNILSNFNPEEAAVFNGKTNDKGEVEFDFKPTLSSQLPGLLKANLITHVHETGGDFSTDVSQVSFSPFPVYVGIKNPNPDKYGYVESGKEHTFNLVSVDAYGKSVSDVELNVKVYKKDWGWWWSYRDDNYYEFTSLESKTPVHSESVETNGSGKASFSFSTRKEDYGKYIVIVNDMNGGHSTGSSVIIDYPYGWQSNRDNSNRNATTLFLNTDKTSYKVGDVAVVTFPSSENGRALVTVENSSQVLEKQWTETENNETKVRIKITEKMSPNAYINVSYIQAHSNTKNDMPIRMYGLMPIEVSDLNTILKPEITMPNELKPEQQFVVNVKETSGKAMSYTLAIVDEGLLDLTRFKTPNAWDKFYSKEALGVETFDVYDDIIGAFGGRINKAFSIGGDQDLGGGKLKKANRFKPVVKYLGPFKLEKGKTAQHKIKMPNYVGSVRAMVVACNNATGAYGCAEKTVQVKSPLMILPSFPRKISPREKVQLPVNIFVNDKTIKHVTLTLKTDKLLRIIASNKQQISFANPEEKMAYFEIEVGDLTGISTLQIEAVGGTFKTSETIEIDIINPNPISYKTFEGVIEKGQLNSFNFEAFGLTGTNKTTLEVSNLPSINLEKRLSYLIHYPHGCIEQTVSAVFPQLYLSDLVDLSPDKQKEIDYNINAAISKLQNFQVPNGGLGYWPGNNSNDDWGSSYAFHFITEAEKKGYEIPQNFKNSLITFQKNSSRDWRYGNYQQTQIAQTYRLYTLALSGNADLSSMNRMKENSDLINESKIRLAATYALAGQKSVAENLMNSSMKDNINYDEWGYYYYGSADRNKAMMIESLLALGKKAEAFKLINEIAKSLSSDKWMSTQTTAYCLMSISKFAKNNPKDKLSVEYELNGKKTALNASKYFVQVQFKTEKGPQKINIRNRGGSMVFVKIIQSGILPFGEDIAEQRNLSIQTAYTDQQGKAISPETLKKGTMFKVKITVNNPSRTTIENIALTNYLPSGWEIINTRFAEEGSQVSFDYTDIRDDRQHFYFGLAPGNSKTFTIELNASYSGKYYLPGIQAEAMYDNDYFARNKGKWVIIEP